MYVDNINKIEDNVAEWLRRLPAKQFPFGSVGSNPAVVVFLRKKKVKDSKKIIQSSKKINRVKQISIEYSIKKSSVVISSNRKKKEEQYKFFFEKNNGGAGYRSPCPSHAKRMLYHMSYTPRHKKGKEKEVETENKKIKKQIV